MNYIPLFNVCQKLHYLNDTVQQQTSATDRHLTANEMLTSYLPQRKCYHGSDVI